MTTKIQNNPIKSADLCERCRFTRDVPCGEDTGGEMKCDCDCPQYSVHGCRCLWVNPNTPCPYFEEAKGA